VTGNVSGGNLTTGAQVVATGNITGGNLTTAGLVSAGTTITATGNVSGGNLTTAGLISAGTTITATGNVAGGNLTTAGRVDATGNVSGGNLITTGQLVATGNVTGALIKASSNVEIQNRGILYLNDSDNSNYIGLRSPATLTGNFTYIFPTGYGNASQVLTTNGAGGLTWEDQSGGGGGGSATSFPNSTVSPVPGSTGNFDLSYNFVQTSQETPFESGATDPFGVNLGEVYSMMDPGGEILDPVDLGALT
jgi:cytoskeletal protein CcmA (bactofilin family)